MSTYTNISATAATAAASLCPLDEQSAADHTLDDPAEKYRTYWIVRYPDPGTRVQVAEAHAVWRCLASGRWSDGRGG